MLSKMPYPRMKRKYFEEVVPKLKKELGYKSTMQVPRLRKICINQGLGAAVSNPKLMETALQELALITGQKAVSTKAKQAISNFKIHKGMEIGARVTLRGDRAYEFIDRFINLVLVRVRDFRGLSRKSFDGHGNYTVGIKEQIVFPEISIDKVRHITGMDITFDTTATDDAEGYALLHALGMPFVTTKSSARTTQS